MLKERPSGINGSCNYKRGLLGSRAIGEWMKDFISILANAAARPNVPLGRLLDRKAA
jgi:hypothetical protein